MKIVKKKISDLKPADYNPRKITNKDMDKLKESILRFGFVEPIIYNKKTGNVVGGHQRLAAVKDLGWEEVDTIMVDIKPEIEKSLNLALNKISGEWDIPKLGNLLSDLRDSDVLLTKMAGFEEEDLIRLIKEEKNDVKIIKEDTVGVKAHERNLNSKFLLFVYEDDGRITVRSKKTDEILGTIYLYAPWKKKVFEPMLGCFFDNACLNDILKFLEAQD